MSPFLIKALQFFLSLSFLIVLHELGHFIPARIFKTRVEKFFLFFDVNFALFKKKIGETIYGIGWLPLGGYVKIAGMIDESMDKEQMAGPPQPWEFRSKPAWQRLIIMIGGVTVNIILGILIYIGIVATWGEDYSKAEDIKYGFGVSKTLEQYGFQQGDQVLAVNGEPLFDDLNIGKHLLVRDVNSVTVKHANGATEKLSLPEDLSDQIFASDQVLAMNIRYPFELDSVVPGQGAAVAGLLASDRIVKINDTPIAYQTDFANALSGVPENTKVAVTYERDGTIATTNVALNEKRQLGIFMVATDEEFIKRNTKEYTMVESISKGLHKGYWTLHDYVAQLPLIFTKKGATSMGGFASIGNMFTAKWNWEAFWDRTALLSIILAFMNILPIPALDGGHVMFLLYEMISGRKPNDKFMEYAQLVGIVLLLGLMLWANGNDVYRWITGGF